MCRSKQALLRGIKPSQQQKNQCGVCTSRCIFCDIWKLAMLVSAHIPVSQRISTSSKLHRSSSRSSTSSDSSLDFLRSEKMIEAQFQTQRARLSSLMSICTVDGADECDGLRLAHDRCLGSVADLMEQERMLESRIVQRPSSSRKPSMSDRRISRECGSNQIQQRQGRSPSLIGMAN